MEHLQELLTALPAILPASPARAELIAKAAGKNSSIGSTASSSGGSNGGSKAEASGPAAPAAVDAQMRLQELQKRVEQQKQLAQQESMGLRAAGTLPHAQPAAASAAADALLHSSGVSEPHATSTASPEPGSGRMCVSQSPTASPRVDVGPPSPSRLLQTQRVQQSAAAAAAAAAGGGGVAARRNFGAKLPPLDTSQCCFLPPNVADRVADRSDLLHSSPGSQQSAVAEVITAETPRDLVQPSSPVTSPNYRATTATATAASAAAAAVAALVEGPESGAQMPATSLAGHAAVVQAATAAAAAAEAPLRGGRITAAAAAAAAAVAAAVAGQAVGSTTGRNNNSSSSNCCTGVQRAVQPWQQAVSADSGSSGGAVPTAGQGIERCPAPPAAPLQGTGHTGDRQSPRDQQSPRPPVSPRPMQSPRMQSPQSQGDTQQSSGGCSQQQQQQSSNALLPFKLAAFTDKLNLVIEDSESDLQNQQQQLQQQLQQQQQELVLLRQQQQQLAQSQQLHTTRQLVQQWVNRLEQAAAHSPPISPQTGVAASTAVRAAAACVSAVAGQSRIPSAPTANVDAGASTLSGASGVAPTTSNNSSMATATLCGNGDGSCSSTTGGGRQHLNRYTSPSRIKRLAWAAAHSHPHQQQQQQQQQHQQEEQEQQETANARTGTAAGNEQARAPSPLDAARAAVAALRTATAPYEKRSTLSVTPLVDAITATAVQQAGKDAAVARKAIVAAGAANQCSSASSPASVTCLPLPPFELGPSGQ